MSDERRYNEEEVREIFNAAAEARASSRKALSSGDGLSLGELKEIGLEVGLAPERIEEAATALTQKGQALPQRKYLGFPLSVGRTVELPRAPTDHEWEVLVAELRETFGARGVLETDGGLRQWSNGNLHALIEPTEAGHRLRLGTLKGSAIGALPGGLSLIGFGGFLTVMGSLKVDPTKAFVLAAFMAGMGLVMIAGTALSLPGWARRRERQMEYIAERARALLARTPEPDPQAG